MKLQHIALGHAATDLALGSLPEVEDELNGAPPDAKSVLEHHEDFLYFHLVCARNARSAMDRLRAWGPDYVAKHREREHALAQASKHYLRLIDMGAAISPLLAEMVLAEGGLTP